MVDDRDYETLAAVRAELRSFAYFTEQMTRSVGLTPQQHQILLALRASKDRRLTVGQLAETMFLKPHSVSGLADRLMALGLVERVRSESDRRSIVLHLTDKANASLAALGRVHGEELRRIRPLLMGLLAQLR